MGRIWDDVISERDRAVVEKGGWGKSRGLGTSPCLMIIDPQYNYVGEDKPILEQQDQWPTGCGAEAWAGIRKIQRLMEVARSRKIPIVYTRQVQRKTLAFDGFARKADRKGDSFLEGHKGTRIVEEIAPMEGDLVVDKGYSSAFYGTPMVTYLNGLGVDTILMTGGTTSGCLRATTVDAVSRNYHVAVVEDCVFDRLEISHKVSLFEMWMKYCDVISLEEALEYLVST
jgi:nicotinamidase-related amidase